MGLVWLLVIVLLVKLILRFLEPRLKVCVEFLDRLNVFIMYLFNECFIYNVKGDLPIKGCYSVEEFVASIQKPRRVVILVQAGKPVDATIAALSEYMEAGDVIIDGGNEWFPNTIRRGEELSAKGIHFIGKGCKASEVDDKYLP